jgi:hypothetical protein
MGAETGAQMARRSNNREGSHPSRHALIKAGRHLDLVAFCRIEWSRVVRKNQPNLASANDRRDSICHPKFPYAFAFFRLRIPYEKLRVLAKNRESRSLPNWFHD